MPGWAAALVAARPYGDLEHLVTAAVDALGVLDDAQLREALEGHARIGEGGHREQRGVLESDRDALAEANRAYEQRFGHRYLVRAAGRSGTEMLALLRERLGHDDAHEAEVVRHQLAEITELRLRDLWVP